jgi:hypothetical protein
MRRSSDREARKLPRPDDIDASGRWRAARAKALVTPDANDLRQSHTRVSPGVPRELNPHVSEGGLAPYVHACDRGVSWSSGPVTYG